jgi:hypothetical protein
MEWFYAHASVWFGQKEGIKWFHLLLGWEQKQGIKWLKLGSAHLFHAYGEDTSHNVTHITKNSAAFCLYFKQ